MSRKLEFNLDPLGIGAATAIVVVLLLANVASAQLPPLPAVPDASPVTDAASDAANTAQDAANTATQTATDTAQEATKSASETAQDTTKSATDAAKSATDAARDTTKSATDSARDATRNATDAARDATRGTTDATRDATRGTADRARDATRDASSAARNAQKGVTDATRDARDATRDATDATRGTARDLRDSARDTTRDARGAAQDARGAARDITRDARDTAQDVGQDARDAAQDVRQDVRQGTRGTRSTARDAAQDVRRNARDINRSIRDTTDDIRDAAGAVVDETRDTLRTDAEFRADTSIRASSDFRGADLGIWFDRSVRDGLVIADVAADAALGQFGFMEGDRIVSVNGRTIAAEPDFMRLVLNPNVSERLTVIVLRDGQQQTLYIDPVVVRERITTVQSDPLERLGIILDDRIEDRIVVWRVMPRSPAFYAGVRPGDVITTFAGQRISAPAEFIEIVGRTDPGMIPIQVTRNGRVRQIEVDYPQYDVARRQTTFRQDLDVEADTRYQDGAARGNRDARGQVDADVDVEVRPPAGRVRTDVDARGQLDTELPDAPDSGYIAPSREPERSGSGYSGSGSRYQRRILPWRRR